MLSELCGVSSHMLFSANYYLHRAGFAEWNVGFMPTNGVWKGIRTQFHHTIGPDKLKQWQAKQVCAARGYIANLLETPDSWMDHTRQYVLPRNLRLGIYRLYQCCRLQHPQHHLRNPSAAIERSLG